MVKAGYKQTEVGVIPEDWDIHPIASLLERNTRVTYGVVQPGKNDPDGVLFIRGGDVFEGRIAEASLRRIPQAVSDQYERTILHGGELLISLVGFPGESAIVPTHLAGANIARQVALVRFAADAIVLPLFVCYYLQSNDGKSLLLREAFGSAQKVINLKEVNLLDLPLPPTKAEQEAIAEALSDADGLIESLEALIAKKRAIKQGAMQELLTGKRRLPGFESKPGFKQTEVGLIPEDWNVSFLGEIAQVKTGPFGSVLHEKDYVSEGTPIITVEHLSERGVLHDNLPMVSDTDKMRLSAYSLKQGDIVFSRVGSVDRNALITIHEDGWLFSGRLLRLRLLCNNVAPEYLSYHFHSEEFKQRVRTVAVGQTMACLNTKLLSGVISVLPNQKEQQAIASVLSNMDAEIEAFESKLAKARTLKQGMMHELLTGRIRLV